MTTSLIPVAIACPCPGAPHGDGDSVYLFPRIPMRMVTEGQIALRRLYEPYQGTGRAPSNAALESLLIDVYVRRGIADWTLIDDKGEPVPLTDAAVEDPLLFAPEAYVLIADRANELYAEDFMRPLVPKASASSPATPTNGSISPIPGGSPKHPKPSKRSSTSTSLTAVTEPMESLPVGASNS